MGVQGSCHEAQHLLVHSLVSLGTAALSASGHSIPMVGAEQTGLGGGIRSLLRTGSDKATCDMAVWYSLDWGWTELPGPSWFFCNLPGGFKQVASCPLVGLFSG